MLKGPEMLIEQHILRFIGELCRPLLFCQKLQKMQEHKTIENVHMRIPKQRPVRTVGLTQDLVQAVMAEHHLNPENPRMSSRINPFVPEGCSPTTFLRAAYDAGLRSYNKQRIMLSTLEPSSTAWRLTIKF